MLEHLRDEYIRKIYDSINGKYIYFDLFGWNVSGVLQMNCSFDEFDKFIFIYSELDCLAYNYQSKKFFKIIKKSRTLRSGENDIGIDFDYCELFDTEEEALLYYESKKL